MDTQAFLQQEAARAAEELGVTDETPKEAAAEAPAEADTTAEPTTEVVEQTEEVPAEKTPVEALKESVQVEDDDDDLYPTFNPQQPQPVPQAQVQPQTPQTPQVPSQPQVPQQVPQIPQLDPSQFTDQYGNVDTAKFAQAMRVRDEQLAGQISSNLTSQMTGNLTNLATAISAQAKQEATNQIMALEADKRAWERTFVKYPQVKENKELRDQIHKMRLGEIAVTGKPVSPSKMADRYFSHIAAAREDGVKQATQTVKVQATAHLETADNTASDKGLKTQKNWDNVGDRNRRTAESARTDILKNWLADGTLKTRV